MCGLTPFGWQFLLWVLHFLKGVSKMDVLTDILAKVSEVSVTVGAIAKALITFLGGIFAARKLPPKQGE